MFTKTLLFVLLACAFTYASSEEQPTEQRWFGDKISAARDRLAEELKKTEEKIKNFLGQVGNTFRSWMNKITGNEIQPKKEKLEELKNRYESLQQESKVALEAKMKQLQDAEARAEENLEQVKLQSNKELENELNTWKALFDDLNAEADKLTESTK